MSGTQLLTQSVNHPLLRLLLEGATIGKKKPYDAWILFRWWRILSQHSNVRHWHTLQNSRSGIFKHLNMT